MSKNFQSSHFKAAREQLGFTQRELAEALFLSRNYVAQIEMGTREPSVRVVNALEELLAKRLTQPTGGGHLKSGGLPDRAEEGRAAYSGEVASRLPQKREPSTRADCEAYVAQLFSAAEGSGDPNAWPVILHRLKREFPLSEWAADAERD